MLAATKEDAEQIKKLSNELQINFFKKFTYNSSNIPPSTIAASQQVALASSTFISQNDNLSTGIFKKGNPLGVGNLSSKTQTQTRLYQLVFESVNGIPVPSPVLTRASKLNSSINCRLSLSLFDLESGAWIGKTWHSPKPIPVLKTLPQGENDDDDDDDEGNDEISGVNDGKLDMLRAHLVGNKLNVKMRNQCVYFHTLLHSKHIVAIFEVSFSVTEEGIDKTDLYCGGWTPIYLFNTKRGGIDVANGDTLDDDKVDIMRVSPLFSGTPRILPFVAPSLFETVSGFPGLSQLPGSSLQYYLIPRPDIKHKSILWKENSFVSTQDTVPGLSSINVRGIQTVHSERLTLSTIKITSPQLVSEFEATLLETIRNYQYTEFPDSCLVDSDGRLVDAKVIERRLVLGFHNSYEFVHPPTIINLDHNMDEEIGQYELSFLGDVRLQHFAGIEGIVLLVSVEYKISIPVKSLGSQSIEKGGFAKLVERLSGGSPSLGENGKDLSVEKMVCVGWGLMDFQFSPDLDKIIPLNCGSIPNPFSSLIYKSFKSGSTTNLHQSQTSIDSKQLLSLELSFSINDKEDPVTGTRTTFPSIKSVLDSCTPKTPNLKPLTDSNFNPLENDKEDAEDIAEIKEIKTEEFSPLPPLPISTIKTGLSRLEKSRLAQAGYETFRDEHGRLPLPVSQSTAIVKSDISLELQDVHLNEITLQFIGITLTDDFKDRSGGITPDSLTFSFRFYTFPDMSTERVKVYTGPLPPNYQHTPGVYKSNQSLNLAGGNKEEEIWPAVLYRIDQDGRPAYDRPAGLSVQFTVDSSTRKSCANIRYGATSFPFYMDQKQLYVDVWNGDSLLLLGTACVDLKMGLRQGKPAIIVDQDIDIIWSEYVDEETGHARMSSTASNSSRQIALSNDYRVRSTKLGSLHMKLINIGRQRNGDASITTNSTTKGRNSIVVDDYHTDVKFRTSSVHQVKRLPEVDSELKNFLQRSYQERVEMKRAAMDKVDPTEPLTEEGKKLQRIYRAMKKDKVDAPFSWDISDYVQSGPDSFVYKQSRQERQKDLEIVEIFRERYKHKTIEESLREQITTKYTIDASFGQGYFFEYVLENPYNIDQVFEIEWDDTDLRVIDSEKEWQYHRKMNGIHQSIEKDFLTKSVVGRAQIFLGAKEKQNIPFLIQFFSTGSMALASSSSGIGSGQHSVKITDETKKSPARVITVSFLNGKRKPIAFLDVLTNPMHFYLDRSIQMFHCENEMVRKTVRFPILHHASLIASGESGPLSILSSPTNEKYLKCSHPDVVCNINPQTHDSKYREISFKYRLGGAPDHSDIFFVFYHDLHCTNVYEIWRISLHTIFRLDVNCTFGQTNMTALVLRGRSMTRQVMCYMNLPNIVSLAQSGPFTLPANSLAEIPLNLRLEGPLDNHVIANVIDVESKSLVSSWYIITHFSMPSITKVFQIKLTRGKPSNKRVSYTNPFLHQKTLILKTDSPNLMQFKSTVMELQGGETQYIGLKFAPCFNLNHAEILVFLNNEMDKVEECLSIEVTYEMEKL